VPSDSRRTKTKEGQTLAAQNEIVRQSRATCDGEGNAFGLLTIGVNHPGVTGREHDDAATVWMVNRLADAAYARLEISDPSGSGLGLELDN